MYTRFKIVKEYKDKKTVLARDQIIAIFTIMTDVHNNYPLKDLNSFGLDSHATRFARPGDLESLSSLLERESNHQQPLLVLGEGSNILFMNHFDGLVLQPGMKGIEVSEDDGEELIVKVGASENWDHLVQYTLDKGWFGLENLSLIPGSVGSAPIQNIGAYGVELRDRFEWLEAWDTQSGQQVRLEKDECKFSYRSSIFKENSKGRFIITHVAFRLSRKPRLQLDYGIVKDRFKEANGSTPVDLRKVIIAIRRSKLPDPSQYGNAGSFFKNPLVDRTIFKCIRVEFPDVPNYPEAANQVKIPAAWLIEKSGWKARRIGNVGTWPAQPLVIVNYGEATGREIFDFSENIVRDVDQMFGITLEREVNVI
jgi:UDP-N-acetylmuramate dehydrogenase